MISGKSSGIISGDKGAMGCQGPCQITRGQKKRTRVGMYVVHSEIEKVLKNKVSQVAIGVQVIWLNKRVGKLAE